MESLLSVVIVSYNTIGLLEACIRSVLSNLPTCSEIIVVDNASTDGSSEMIKKTFSMVRLIENKENLGFGKANNQGITISRGQYILLLNSDAEIKPNAINIMINFIGEYPTIGMIGPRLLNDDGTTQPSVSTLPNLWYVFLRMFRLKGLFPTFLKTVALRYGLFGHTVKSHFQSEANKALEVDFITGACMLIRRDVIEQVGMFDENFFMYVEDVDLCKRIKESGWKIYYYPESEIVHFGGRSSGGACRDLSFVSYKSLYYYFRKHYGKPYELGVRLIVVIALGIRAGFNLMLRPIRTIKGENRFFRSYLTLIRCTITK
ncbi:MAG: glycosyltransferase family 2 protein [Nitrospirae bacterium]|nr:glycosyltransferase family 2 protein [Nitrospirota bacterium]